jgi:hypothetical protein
MCATNRAGRFGTEPRPGLVAASGAGLLVALAYVAIVDPENPLALMPRCPTRALTGLECPGCGGLRMVSALMHGNLRRAASANAFLLLASPVLAYLLYCWARATAAGISYQVPVHLARILGVGAVIWTIQRNFWRITGRRVISGRL